MVLGVRSVRDVHTEATIQSQRHERSLQTSVERAIHSDKKYLLESSEQRSCGHAPGISKFETFMQEDP